MTDQGGNPRIAELGRDFWEHGKGALWIRWGSPNATTRCHRLVMQHAGMSDENAWGYCAERHHAVLGTWPGQKAAKGGKGKGKGRRDADGLAPAQLRGAVEIGGDVDDSIPAERAALGSQPETREVPFELDGDGDGLNFSGYAAVFNFPAAIRDSQGEFLESFAPGSFAESLRATTPVLMFNHGKHPLIGDLPLGVITEAREDDHGLYIAARLTDNWLVHPVRDAIRDGAVSGMSFRFSVPEGGQEWTREDGRDSRRVTRARVPELGPVVFPAYSPTTASVRSAFDHLPDLSGASVARSAERGHEDGQAAEAAKARVQRGRQLLLRGIR